MKTEHYDLLVLCYGLWVEVESISETHMYLVPLERSWKEKNNAVWIIALSCIVAKLLCFKDSETFLKDGEAIIRDAAIKPEITVVSFC